jgi:parvulin-like peptidyl-prolyl isomerase
MKTPQTVRRFVAHAARSLLIAACAIPVCLCGGRAVAQQTVDRVIASVDGDPITLHDVRAFSAANGKPIPDGSDPRAPDLIRRALKQLIQERLLESETKRYESQIDDTQVDKFIDQLRQQNHMTEQQFRDEMARSGVTYEDMRKRARLELEKMAMLDKEVRSKVSVSDGEVKAYYQAHPDDFMVKTERYRLAQILVALPPNPSPAHVAAAREKAELVRKRAVSGDDFGQLAQQFSDDDSKSKGGELGYFAPDELLDEIRAAIAKLKPGDISSVIRTRYGFHIIEVEEHQTPGVRPLDRVSDQIREKLIDEKSKRYFQEWLDKDLVKDHHVESFY